MNINKFKNLINSIEAKARKKYDGAPIGLTILATELTNYYFNNFYTIKHNFTLEDDFKLHKLTQLVCIDLLRWLGHNYFHFIKPFNFQKSIKKWEKKIEYSRN